MGIALGVTAVLAVGAGAQTPKAQKGAEKPTKQVAAAEEGAPAAKGSQAIVVLVNDEPVTAWEIEQRASLIAANSQVNPKEMQAKASARWQQVIKDPKTNERFQEMVRQSKVTTQEQANELQKQFAAKLQGEIIEQVKRDARTGMTNQYRKRAQEELIDERLRVQEGKKLGVEITEEDLKRVMTNIAKTNKMTLEQFTQHVKSSGFDPSTLRERIRAEQVWREVIRRRYGSTISIAEKDIEAMLSKDASEAGEDAVELQVQKIILPVQGRGDQTALARRYADAQALQSPDRSR
jgi:peptidyl-prolyl cis-trans isomerase SurA